MSLEKWVEYGWLRREPTSTGEIKDLLGIVDRSLADSKVEAVSTDLRFIAAFNAALCIATHAADRRTRGTAWCCPATFVLLRRTTSGLKLSALCWDGLTAGTSGEAPRRVSVLLRSSALLQLLHFFIHVEAGRLLPLRIVLEGHKELAHIGLRRN
jgi:hypothetical protein